MINKKFQLTDFVKNSAFNPQKAGTTITISSQEFENYINNNNPINVIPGYAPFCMLMVFENWTDTKAGTMAISSESEKFLRSGYVARNENELPVLSRWIEGVTAPVATHLVVVSYTRDQLLKEGNENIYADFGVVAILAQMHPNEEPMPPITMMRNALGIEEGGSGVDLDKSSYMKSVRFWEEHAIVKM